MTKATECRNFVIAGHAGSGKSTLSELMLYKAGAIGRPGTVDAKNTVSDFMADRAGTAREHLLHVHELHVEKQSVLFRGHSRIWRIHRQAAAAVRAADAALVVIDAIDGPQVGTARAWKMTKERRIPRFALVNRLDKERADFKATLEVMRGNHGRSVIIPFTGRSVRATRSTAW